MAIGSIAANILASVIGTSLVSSDEDNKNRKLTRSWDEASDMDDVTVRFTITARKRWVKQIIGMFNTMQSLGSMGSSRVIGFFSDGDGDFRPRFTVNGDDLWNPEFGHNTRWGQEGAESRETPPLSQPNFFYDAG